MSTTHNIDHFESNDILPRSYQEDIVEGVYKIHVERLVNELSNQFCRYYFATNLKSEKEYFAIVFERSFNPPIHEIEILKTHPNSNINKLLAYSLVKLSTSRKYQLVVIVEAYDPLETLQHFIETNGPMDSGTIQDRLIPDLVKCIEFGNIHDINYGNINPQNIILTKDNRFILKEFVIGLPNFYQPPSYLAPEIGDTIQTGRVTKNSAADIYAIGMTVYYSMSGLTINFNHHDPKFFNAERIEEGSYDIIAKKVKIPKALRIFLSSTLSDSPSYRWDNTQLYDWLSHAQTMQLPKVSNAKNISGHTILFEGHNYSYPEALASAVYACYESGIRLCNDEHFIKWVQKAKGKTDYIEDLIHLTNNNRIFSSVIDSEKEEMMLKMFSMLDIYSPIRLKDFCITVESIPNILFASIYNENKPLFDQLSKILRRNYWKIVLTSEYKDKIPYENIEQITSLASAFTANASDYIGKQQLYLCDRYIPCLSPTVIGDYVLSLADLLVSLDKIAAHTPSKLSIDEHIAAFVASRLPRDVSLEDKLGVEEEHLAKSVMLKGVSLLAIAQENTHDIKIPHLCSIVAQKLIEWINDNLHSTKLKKVITSEIAELAPTGSLSQILYVISNPQLFKNDYRGYKVAYQQTLDLTETIGYLSDENHVHELGLALGQRLTVLFSYFLFMLVALILMI